MDSQTILLITTALLLFGGVLAVVLGASDYLAQRGLILQRLAGRSHGAASGADGEGRAIVQDNLLQDIARYVTPQSAKDLSAVRNRLIRAGYRRPSAVRVYYVARAGLGLGSGLLAALLVPMMVAKLALPVLLLLVLAPTLVGFLMPSLWVERQIQYRYQAAEQGFPDALDMLLVCIEAGHGLDQALRRLSREIHLSNPILAGELSIVSDELRAGKQRAEVLRDFADRIGVPDISAFVTVLKQSDEFGVSIAEALRVYASEMRNKRVMRAEEKANKIPVKLALGSIFFTVPPIMLILAGPSFIMIVRSFAGMT